MVVNLSWGLNQGRASAEQLVSQESSSAAWHFSQEESCWLVCAASGSSSLWAKNHGLFESLNSVLESRERQMYFEKELSWLTMRAVRLWAIQRESVSRLEETLTHHHLFLSVRWLQPQSVKGHQQCTVYGAWMFWLRGRLPVGGRAAHRAPQPRRSKHAQWSRHGAAGPICGGYFSQWQTLNVKIQVSRKTHTHTWICSV